MIQSFASVDTRTLFETGRCHRRWQAVSRVAPHKLDMLDAAVELEDLRSPPGIGSKRFTATVRASTAFASTTSGGSASSGAAWGLSRSKSSIITDRGEAMSRLRTHPGEILDQEFLVPLGLTRVRLASELDSSVANVSSLLRGRRPVSADMAIRLSRRFGTTPQFWLNLQNSHDLSQAEATNDYSAIRQPNAA